MNWLLKGKWIAGWLGLSLVLMGIVSVISYQNATQLSESADKIDRTHEVLKSLTDIFAILTDAESGLRGYILFKDESELKRYHIAIQSIAPKIQILRQRIATNPSQQQRLTILESLLVQRLALFQRSIDLYQSGDTAISSQAALVAQSNRNKDEIWQLIAEMQSEEEEFLEMWIGDSHFSIRYRMLIEFLSTFFSFAILFGVFGLLYRQMIERQKLEIIRHTLAQEKELSELKLRFFSMVSHEFRTPLSIILGSAQLLTESNQQWTESKKLKNLHRIQSSARLMSQLLTDILTLTRAEAGKLECNPELVDLESFCLNLIEDMHFGSESRHSIQFVSKATHTYAKLDEKLLYSILSNLLSNAIKYSPQRGNIYFILSDEPEAVIFQIKDEGIGIPIEDQQALYEPFHRSKNVGDIVGSGLGLAVVKKCLDLHQGQIFGESQVGNGTTFTVKIPQRTALVNTGRMNS